MEPETWDLPRAPCHHRHQSEFSPEIASSFFAAPIHFKHHLAACERDICDLNGDARRDELASRKGGFLVLLPVKLSLRVDDKAVLVDGQRNLQRDVLAA